MKQKKYLILSLFIICLLLQSCNHRQHNERKNRLTTSHNQNRTTNTTNKTVIKMKKQSGVYFVPCKINGSEMEFIFWSGVFYF